MRSETAWFELITEFDVLHESITSDGLLEDKNYNEIVKKLRMHANQVNLMVNSDEPLYDELMKGIEQTISILVHGIKDYNEFHLLNAKVASLAQAAIRSEWKKIAP